jgi:hypothetical protein
MLRLLESHTAAAQQLSTDQLEVLLLQCMAWQSSETVHIDDERPRVLRALWKLPGVAGLSGESVADIAAALIAAGDVPTVPTLLQGSAAQSLSASAIFAVAEGFVEYPYSFDKSAVRVLLQLPGAHELTAGQVSQLLAAAIIQQHSVMLELLLQHPAAPRDGLLLAWAPDCLKAGRARELHKMDIEELLYGRLCR